MRRMNWTKFLRVGLGIVILFFLAIYIRATPWGETAVAIRQVGFGFCWIVISTFVAYLLATLGWYYCLGSSREKIGIWRLFLIRHVGETLGLFNPASVVGGDLVKVSLLNQQLPDKAVVTSSVYISRLFMVISQLLLFLIALCWMLLALPAAAVVIPRSVQVWLLAVICMLLIAGCWILARLAGGQPSLSGSIPKTKLGMAMLLTTNPRLFLRAFICFLLHWLVGSVEVFMLLHYLGYHISLMHGLFMDMGVIIFKSAGAFIPGQLGIEEMGNKMMLLVMGIGSSAAWLSLSVLRRVRQLCWALAGVLFYLVLFKRKTAPLVAGL